MLKLQLAQLDEAFDQSKQQIVSFPPVTFLLENSLYSLSLWESQHETYFLGNKQLKPKDYFDYFVDMIVDDGGYPNRFNYLNDEELKQITDYINQSNTATTFRSINDQTAEEKIVTSEVIYYWMTCFNIPFEADRWNLNRLITLIRVCSEKNKTPRKLSRNELAASRTAENLRRRKAMHTKG